MEVVAGVGVVFEEMAVDCMTGRELGKRWLCWGVLRILKSLAWV